MTGNRKSYFTFNSELPNIAKVKMVDLNPYRGALKIPHKLNDEITSKKFLYV